MPSFYYRAVMLLMMFVGLVIPAASSAFEVSARIDRTVVDRDGRINLAVTVEGAGRGELEIDLGVPEQFQVYSAGTSQNISIVNGTFSSQRVYNYVISPREPGKYTIGPIVVRDKGETARSEALEIEVTDGGTTPLAQEGRKKTPRPSSDDTPEVFIRSSLDKKKAYVGEQVTLTFLLFHRIRFWSDPEYTPASSEGFWKEDLPPQNRYFEDVGGHRYRVTEIKTALFPTRPGRLVVGPIKLVYEQDRFRSGDPFAAFRRGGSPFRSGGRRVLETDSLSLEVLRLPTVGRPSGFSGTVGRFNFRASVDRKEVNANEPITITVVIEGEGNVKTASIPPLELSEIFKVYDSGTSTETSKKNYRLRGKKEHRRVIVPRFGGNYTLPALEFTYFDPQAERYVTLMSDPFRIQVEGPAFEEPVGKTEIARHESDLRYIKESPGSHWIPIGATTSIVPFILWNLAPLFLIGLVWGIRIGRKRLEGDAVQAKARRAGSITRKALSQAMKLTEDSTAREFSGALSNALTDYFQDRGDLPVSGMTRRELLRELKKRGFQPTLLSRIEEIVQKCDYGRFSEAEFSPDERKSLLREAEEIVWEAERAFREGKGP